jgi:hypothetical protein
MSRAILSIIPFHESANNNITGTNQFLFTVDVNVSETDRCLIIKFKVPDLSDLQIAKVTGKNLSLFSWLNIKYKNSSQA